MRYSFFSDIHRYIRSELYAVSVAAAKVDFRVESQRTAIKKKFETLIELLQGHAGGEEMFQTPLLKEKKSLIENKLHDEHEAIDKEIAVLNQKLEKIMKSKDPKEQEELGYEFYLAFTGFIGNYSQHLIGEETIIMPELHRLYSDKELRSVTLALYPQMPKEKIDEMVQTFFPCVSAIEREAMLTDIKDSLSPERFRETWNFIAPTLEPQERKDLTEKLNIGSLQAQDFSMYSKVSHNSDVKQK